ncbi:hypothetical protein NIES2100_40210 [Calothrix sp. NIES-2100]|nr:hypothetical protein NIES2100_40210 [Calothrix sp. NIES-2100]
MAIFVESALLAFDSNLDSDVVYIALTTVIENGASPAQQTKEN